MLQSIRDRLSGPLVWFVVGLICIPFAFWGIESFRGGGADPVVAKVGSDEITQSRYDAGANQRYRQLQSLMGEQFRADLIDQARFRQSVLDDMVQESMLRQFARGEGYRADDAALLNYLSAIPAFQDNGKFSASRYRDVLTAQGYSPEDFEAQIRDALVVEQLRDAVVGSSFASPSDAYAAYRLSQQKRTLTVARIAASRFSGEVHITQEQIATRYEHDQARFMTPERIKLSYLLLDATTLPEVADPGDEVLKVIYDAQKDGAFSTPEERKARHILVNFGADKAAAKKKAEALAEQIRGGADFAAVARAESDDSGSKASGGELGWIKRGMMTGDFEDALFKLEPGALSEPVETEFGWHLIQLEELKPPTVRAFSEPEVRAQLLETYRTQEAAARFQEMAEQLDQLAFENPASLDPAAEALGIPLATTDWFTRAGGAGIAANAAVIQAAFSAGVLDAAENSEPIPLENGQVVVVRKADYEAARQKPLAEVDILIREQLRSEQLSAMATALGQTLQAEVLEGKTLAEAAKAHASEVMFEGSVDRSGGDLDPAVLARAFKMPHPHADTPELSQVVLSGGDIAVLSLNAVEDPAMPSLDDGKFQQIQATQRDRLAGAEFAAYRVYMESEIDIDIRANPAAEPAADGLE